MTFSPHFNFTDPTTLTLAAILAALFVFKWYRTNKAKKAAAAKAAHDAGKGGLV